MTLPAYLFAESMGKPKVPDTGHAFLVILGGEYQSSVITESLVTLRYVVPTRFDDGLVELHLAGGLEGMWSFGENDFRWVSTDEIKEYICTEFDGLAKDTRDAILSYNGAWVMRVYVKPRKRR
jgi:hypothetical protein